MFFTYLIKINKKSKGELMYNKLDVTYSYNFLHGKPCISNSNFPHLNPNHNRAN